VWDYGVDAAIFDAVLTLLPVNLVSTFTVQNRTRLRKEFWLSHASRLPLLEQARLVTTSVRAFGEMLAEDTPPGGPRLPSLTKLILLDVTLTALRTCHLRDMLIKRVEQGAPLEVLDLRTCIAADRAIQFLAEIVVDVQEPDVVTMEEVFKDMEMEYCGAVEYDDAGRRSWYGDIYYGESEDEDEDEAEHDDEFDYEDAAEHDDEFDYEDVPNYDGLFLGHVQ